MIKLEQIDYNDAGRMGPNILLMKTDALKVGEGIRISCFPDYREMRKLTLDIEAHLSNLNIFRRVANESNLTYTIRRIA